MGKAKSNAGTGKKTRGQGTIEANLATVYRIYGTIAVAASHAIRQVSRCISYDCSWRYGLNSEL